MNWRSLLTIQDVQYLSVVNVITVDPRFCSGKHLTVVLCCHQRVDFSLVPHQFMEFCGRDGGVDTKRLIFTANRDV